MQLVSCILLTEEDNCGVLTSILLFSFDGLMMEIGAFRSNQKAEIEWTTPGGAWNEYADVLYCESVSEGRSEESHTNASPFFLFAKWISQWGQAFPMCRHLATHIH